MNFSGDLVSVCVIMYNSEETIKETLESVKNQTYSNIELIISDDGSTDNTIKICEEWCNVNKTVFSNLNLISVLKNTGISANANRCVNVSRGKWIKIIGADDTLKANCISENISFISKRPEIKILQSKMDFYKETFEEKNFILSKPTNDAKTNLFFELTPNEQYIYLLQNENPLIAGAFFLNKQTILDIGGFDDRFTMMEDVPLWLKLTKAGTKIFYMPTSMANYRVHQKSVTNNDFKQVNIKYIKTSIRVIEEFYPKELRTVKLKKQLSRFKTYVFLDSLKLNNNSFLGKASFKAVNVFLR